MNGFHLFLCSAHYLIVRRGGMTVGRVTQSSLMWRYECCIPELKPCMQISGPDVGMRSFISHLFSCPGHFKTITLVTHSSSVYRPRPWCKTVPFSCPRCCKCAISLQGPPILNVYQVECSVKCFFFSPEG